MKPFASSDEDLLTIYDQYGLDKAYAGKSFVLAVELLTYVIKGAIFTLIIVFSQWD